MESPYYEITHDFEEENRLVASGYVRGYHDAMMKYPEIVRCKYCKHGEPGVCGDGVVCNGVWHDNNWFCADGER